MYCRIGTLTIDSYCLLGVWLFCSVFVLGGGSTNLWWVGGGVYQPVVGGEGGGGSTNLWWVGGVYQPVVGGEGGGVYQPVVGGGVYQPVVGGGSFSCF